MSVSYPNTELFINGKWRAAISNDWLDVINPATEESVGKVAVAQISDLDEALDAANAAFKLWRNTPPFARYKIMRRAADLLRERADSDGRPTILPQPAPHCETRDTKEHSEDLRFLQPRDRVLPRHELRCQKHVGKSKRTRVILAFHAGQ